MNRESSGVRDGLRRTYQDKDVARTYEEERDFREGDISLHYETEVLALSDALGDVKGPVLEVAVGTGRLCRRLQRFGTDYVGIDVSMQMLGEAKNSLWQDTRRPRLIRGDAFELPFKDAHFSAAICFRFIKHLDAEGRRAMYKEIKRVLRDDGILVFDFYGWRRRSAKKTKGDRVTVSALRGELEKNGLRLTGVYGTRHMLCDAMSLPFRWLKIRPAVRTVGWIGIKVLSPLDALLDRSRGGIAVCKNT